MRPFKATNLGRGGAVTSRREHLSPCEIDTCRGRLGLWPYLFNCLLLSPIFPSSTMTQTDTRGR